MSCIDVKKTTGSELTGNVMSKYMTLHEFRRRYFTDHSRPRGAVVKSWINDGMLRGVTIGGRIYVKDDDATALFQRAAAPTDTRGVVDNHNARIKTAWDSLNGVEF